jgi:hypothetical protein
MQAVTGVFSSKADAESAVATLRSNGVPSDKITLLIPGDIPKELKSVPVDATEESGMGKAIGAILGAATGLSGGSLLAAALIPGVGPVTAIGLLGGAVLAAAGGSIGAATGQALENSMSHGIAEDEIFVYEDALRRGRSVVIVLADDAAAAPPLRTLLQKEGAEAIDAARQQWWIGLRSAEQEHYATSGRSFREDEKFYRRGFEAALHARNRCKEFDQVSAEMESNLEDLQREHPGEEVAEPYTRGYQRGREYYQRVCDQSKAA